MFQSPHRTIFLTYLITGIAAAALLQQGLNFAAVLTLFVGGGLAMARPVVRQRRLMLRGTPVLLMFAVMLVSASGMTLVADSVTTFVQGDPEPVVERGCSYRVAHSTR